MYALISGILEEIGPPTVVVAGGVGYELFVPERSLLDLPALGEEVRLYTHLQVREDDHTLYGFETKAEREIFRALLSVNGVGPKVALTILGSPQAESVLAAVAAGDSRPLLAVKGIGKKTAERIVLELEEKAAAWTVATSASVPSASHADSLGGLEEEAALVLESLGMSIDRAREVIRTTRASVARDVPSSDKRGVEDLVRAALRQVTPSS